MSKGFPDFFPDNFEVLLKNIGAKEQNLNVYRICRNGTINRDAFLSSYEDGLQNKHHDAHSFANRDVYNLSRSDLSLYSTSCFQNYKDVKRILGAMAKTTPMQIVAQGTTNPQCGPCLASTNNSHVDWWIYKDAHPECHFHEFTKKGE